MGYHYLLHIFSQWISQYYRNKEQAKIKIVRQNKGRGRTTTYNLFSGEISNSQLRFHNPDDSVNGANRSTNPKRRKMEACCVSLSLAFYWNQSLFWWERASDNWRFIKGLESEITKKKSKLCLRDVSRVI